MDTLIKKSDQQLVHLAKKGNKHAFDILFTRYRHKVISLLSRYVNDISEAMDLSQDVFLRAYSALPQFREDSAFYTWLYRVAINTAKNNLMQNQKRLHTMRVDFDDPSDPLNKYVLPEIDTPEECIISNEIELHFNEAVAALPEELKISFILCEIEALSYEDIADVLDCPMGTVRSRIFRARQFIEKKINS